MLSKVKDLLSSLMWVKKHQILNSFIIFSRTYCLKMQVRMRTTLRICFSRQSIFYCYHMLIELIDHLLLNLLQAVYGTLFEAEHRSTFYIPYWKFPLARWIVPRQRKFRDDLKVINTCLDGLIRNAKESREVR